MRLQFHLQRRPVLVTTLGATAALLAASPAFAQQNNDNNNNNDEDGDGNDPQPPPPQQPTGGNNNNNNNNNNDNNNDDNNDDNNDEPESSNPPAPAPTNTNPPNNNNDNVDNNDASSSSDSPSSTASDPDEPTATATNSDQDEPTSTEDNSATTTNDAEATAVVTTDSGGRQITASLTRGFGIPTYPAAAVPPTHHAPFMQHSNAPDGTVFIAVGAILGAFGLGILLWRVIIGLLLHRSVERAAMAQHDANSKAGFPAPPAPFYKYTDHASNMSLSGGAAAGRGVRRTNRGPIPSSNPSQSNLFFSPTAAASGNGGNRASTFLPSGFYAAGAGSNNANHGHSISLTNLRPDSRGHGAAARNGMGPSPPDSPAFPARRDLSSTSLNLNRPSSQRAPSAYLDDLLADDPGALPPPHMPPSNGPSRNSANLGPGSNRF